VRCLDGVEPSDFQLSSFDGKHWEESVVELRVRTRKRQ
jgi:hypothetical protein